MGHGNGVDDDEEDFVTQDHWYVGVVGTANSYVSINYIILYLHPIKRNEPIVALS